MKVDWGNASETASLVTSTQLVVTLREALLSLEPGKETSWQALATSEPQPQAPPPALLPLPITIEGVAHLWPCELSDVPFATCALAFAVFLVHLLGCVKGRCPSKLHISTSRCRHTRRPVSTHGVLLLAPLPLLVIVALGFVATTSAKDLNPSSVYSLSHTPSDRRALHTVVSDVTSLTSAIADASVSRIIIAPGHYALTVELSVTRSVIIEAEVIGTAVLDAGETVALSYGEEDESRRVMSIDVGPTDTVQLIGLNVTGGSVAGYSSSDACTGRVRTHSLTVRRWLLLLTLTFVLSPHRAVAFVYLAVELWSSNTYLCMATMLQMYALAFGTFHALSSGGPAEETSLN